MHRRTIRARTLLLSSLILLVASSSSAAAPPPLLSFTASGLDGGGFVNVVAVDPSGSGLVLAGGDVSGFHRSTDWGRHWSTANAGLTATPQLAVAAIELSTTVPGLVYAGVGQRGAGGGLLVSTDDGASWTLRSTVPQFSGSNNDGVPGIPHTHPRSTGDLLAIDEARGFLYAATFDQGVLRSSDDGVTWTVLGLAGSHLRGLAFDPSDPDVLYVAAYNDGVYRTGSASTTGLFSKLPGSPLTPEELRLVDGSLYVAGGKAGLFRTRDGGASWKALGSGAVPVDGPAWMSIDAYRACGRDVIYAGANAAGADSVMQSTDDGTTWSSVTADPLRVHDTIGGSTGPVWWLFKQARMRIGGSFYAAAQIALDPTPPVDGSCLQPRLLVAGRSGVWSSEDAAGQWYPMMRGLGVTIARDVAIDPGVAGRAYVATADWVFHRSTDLVSTVTQKKPPGGTTAADLAVDTSATPGRVYVASGNPSSNSGGEVYSSPNPLTSGWTDEGLSGVASGRRPLAIAVRKVGAQRILLAAVDRGGVWRKVGSTWTKVNGVAMSTSQPSRGASIAWPAGSTSVYLFDRESGVWRSGDNGRTWTKIWSVTSSSAMTGYLAVDPAAPGRLFVSIDGAGLFRIDGATSGSVDAGTLTPVSIPGVAASGVIELGPGGELYAVQRAAPGVTPTLLRSDDDGDSWVAVSDDLFAGAAGFAFDLAVTADGHVLVSTNGNGVLVGSPA